METRRRRPVDPTDDWEQLVLPCFWEGLARCEVAVWFDDGEMEMAVGYGGRTLSRYGVSLSREAKLEAVTNPRLFATQYSLSRR